MNKIKVYLDMDGTIYPLYSQKEWLNRLRNEDVTVFTNDSEMVSEKRLRMTFPEKYFDVRIFSMTPKNASAEFCEKVIKAKNAWLDEHFPSIKTRIYRKYGDNKNLAYCGNAILIDDSENIRKRYMGAAIDPRKIWG